MAFNGLLRPGQGFKKFTILRRSGATTETGRPYTGSLEQVGSLIGIISQASPKEQEQWKQLGTPITHTIVQRGTTDRAMATDVLQLETPAPCGAAGPPTVRKFLVKGQPQNPGELGHFLVYRVEEREDLQ